MNNETRSLRSLLPRLGNLPALGLLAGLVVSAAGAEAQEWRLEPELRLGAEYDDNARLRSDPAQIQEIDGFIFEGALGIGYNTQRSGLKVTPRLRSRVYDETPDVDSNDQFLDLGYNYQGLKSEFSLNGSYGRESVRTAERTIGDIDTDNPDDIPTDDTGLVFSNQRRTRFRISPQWEYELTERMLIGAAYTYQDTSYDETVGSFLRDYTDQRIQASLGRKFTERTRGYIGVGARRYEDDAGTNQVDGVGALVGIESEISQTTSLQAEIGYEDTEESATGQSDANMVANLNLVRRLETLTLLAQYRRNVAAGGTGRVTARDSVNFNVKKRFTERVAGGVFVRAYQTDAVGNQVVALEERDQSEVGAELEIALSRAFSLEAKYSYTKVDRSNQEGSADSNNVLLWLVYRPTPIIN